MTTEFPLRARTDDAQGGYLIVQKMLYFLRDVFDAAMGKMAHGSATILATTTSIPVTIPATVGIVYSVNVVPTVDPGSRYWVSGKTDTSFTINLQSAPAGAVGFDWSVRGA